MQKICLSGLELTTLAFLTFTKIIRFVLFYIAPNSTLLLASGHGLQSTTHFTTTEQWIVPQIFKLLPSGIFSSIL